MVELLPLVPTVFYNFYQVLLTDIQTKDLQSDNVAEDNSE
jgi:hypothetical protein